MGETSYNGWPASPDKNAINIVPFGDKYGVPFPGGVRDGDVKTVLGYVASQLHYRVEACISGWDWGYSYRANVNNPSVLSCHASGTAIDYNAPLHPNGARNTFTSTQKATIYDILAEVSGSVQWGGDYAGTVDEMHFEIIVNSSTLAKVAATLPTNPNPNPPIPPEDFPVSLEVMRAGGIDYGYADDLSFFMRIPTEDFYKNLQFLNVVTVDHGKARGVDQNIVDWTRGVVASSGGRVYEPAE